ncbi:SIS domain-containing protein [Rhodocaloribacter sp.]
MVEGPTALSPFIAERLRARNDVSRAFFPREAPRLAEASRRMAGRFLDGGRILAFGRGPYATDARHVSVEFVHPVIVGKRALPALDLGPAFAHSLPVLVAPSDIVMGFGPPGGDALVARMLDVAAARGALTFALPGATGDYAVAAPSDDPFLHQEMIEILYHTLWETVHVFLEHREMGHDVGASSFLYPFLGETKADTPALLEDVAASIVMKARDDERLRETVAETHAGAMAEAAAAMHERLRAGGKLLLFGNGGSATDANDWAVDAVMPPPGRPALPALSLAAEPAILTAVANDVGVEVLFLRQLIAHARPNDVAVGISTSGGSKNIVMALEEARRRGMLTVALLGYDGGEIARRGLADHALVVPSDYVPRIQEVQASMYHTLMETLYVLIDEHN